jgi:photosystem II stability/assembly factor-like uncharacterized protein
MGGLTMRFRWSFSFIFVGACMLALCIVPESARPDSSQPFTPALYGALKWRLIGPFRGGRVLAVTGITTDPNVYYFGAVGGGVWKTSNGGVTWEPIFDSERVASIGAIAAAPSNPNILYVGTGEADMRSDISFGNGVYRSDDAGKSWHYLGLADTEQIGRIVINPRNPDMVLVAALGHAYGPNERRGVFRSADGGHTWQKVLYRDANTGAIELSMDSHDSDIVYAAMWNARRPPWSTYAPIQVDHGGPGSGLFQSLDGGLTWKELNGNGLPAGAWGRVGVAIASGTNARRVYALIDAKKGGLYRSDDSGATWALEGNDPRITTRAWYFSGVTVDPKNPDIVYVADVAVYRSTDGGHSFTAFKGAPGGDDYHQLWIDPQDPARMILGCDQGAVISVDRGRTWSSWYNQPTAQFYHVSTDNAFPYHVYGAQQDSGTVAILSRSDIGSITIRDWYSIGAGESGYIRPDPQDPNIVYGGDTYGGLRRYDRRTNQSQDIGPTRAEFFGNISQRTLRFTWTSPLEIAPWDSSVLYLGSQYLLRSDDRGNHWEKISPDLTGLQPASVAAASGPPTIENTVARGFGVIYAIAPSPVARGVIWIGTDTGRIQLTRDDGKTWTEVTPTGLSDWSKIGILEPSHFDAATAYAAVDRHRLDDFNSHIYRTHDFGKSWTEISRGLPGGEYANVVREDPVRRGLLYAGTELGVYVSFDDGDHWESLQLNLPATSVRDLAIHGADLVAATHGRSFWILDDVSPLRQLTAATAQARASLFQPESAVRVRTKEFDTPLPHEFPAATNFPDGAVLDYVLRDPSAEGITLDILDSSGHVVRHYSSQPAPQPATNKAPFTDDWIESVPYLTKNVGMNRIIWDMHYSPPGGSPPSLRAKGPWALPGDYQVRLRVAGEEFTQPLRVVMDPRVETPAAGLRKQFVLASEITDTLGASMMALREIYSLEKQVSALLQTTGDLSPEIHIAAENLTKQAATLHGGGDESGQYSRGLVRVGRMLEGMDDIVNSADAAPTAQAQSMFAEQERDVEYLLSSWRQLKGQEFVELNQMLRAAERNTIDLTRDVPEDYDPLAGEDD